MCEVLPPYSSTKLTEDLLNDFNILIKDLSSKFGFEGQQYIRIAVKNREENQAIVIALKKLLGK